MTHIDTVCGGSEVFAQHQSCPVIAQAAGCLIMVHEMVSDSKFTLHQHNQQVRALSFLHGSQGQISDFLISIDQEKMFVWDWRKKQVLQVHKLALQDLKSQFKITYSGQLLFIIQTTKSQYECSVWHIQPQPQSDSNKLALLHHSMLNQDTLAHDVGVIPSETTAPSLDFYTVEPFCLKFWHYQYKQNQFQLLKRIHIKSEVTKCVMSAQFVFLLGLNGRVLVLDRSGTYITTISVLSENAHQLQTAYEEEQFSSLFCMQDKIMLGTSKGRIHVHQLQTFKKISVIPNQFYAFTQSADTNQEDQQRVLEQTEVTNISSSSNLRFLLIRYADGAVVMIDREVQNSKLAIIAKLKSHKGAIKCLKYRQYGRQVDQHCITIERQFATCSPSDQSVLVWSVDNDRLNSSQVNLKGCPCTALCFYPKRTSMMLVGDAKQCVQILQVGEKNITQVNSFYLEFRLKASAGEITGLYVTTDEKYAVVQFKSGLISLFDVYRSFEWIIDIHESVQSLASLVPQEALVFEIPKEIQKSYLSDSDQLMRSLTDKAASTVCLLILTAPNTLNYSRLRIGADCDEKPTVSVAMQYVISEGRITGYALHPSYDYLMVSSNQGRVYLFKLQSGELRGTIGIPYNASHLQIDPAGIYFATLCRVNHDPSQKVILGEVGTGRLVASIQPVFEVAKMSFTNEEVLLCSAHGDVSIWRLSEHLLYNINRVSELVKNVPTYWSQIQIYLPDYQTKMPIPPEGPNDLYFTVNQVEPQASLGQNRQMVENGFVLTSTDQPSTANIHAPQHTPVQQYDTPQLPQLQGDPLLYEAKKHSLPSQIVKNTLYEPNLTPEQPQTDDFEFRQELKAKVSEISVEPQPQQLDKTVSPLYQEYKQTHEQVDYEDRSKQPQALKEQDKCLRTTVRAPQTRLQQSTSQMSLNDRSVSSYKGPRSPQRLLTMPAHFSHARQFNQKDPYRVTQSDPDDIDADCDSGEVKCPEQELNRQMMALHEQFSKDLHDEQYLNQLDELHTQEVEQMYQTMHNFDEQQKTQKYIHRNK